MQKKVCEVCRRPYESEDHECREAMSTSDGGRAEDCPRRHTPIRRGDDFNCGVLGEDSLATAGIHVGDHLNAIECHGATLDEAQRLRERVLALLVQRDYRWNVATRPAVPGDQVVGICKGGHDSSETPCEYRAITEADVLELVGAVAAAQAEARELREENKAGAKMLAQYIDQADESMHLVWELRAENARLRSLLRALLHDVKFAISSGDWRVDGRCDPTITIERAEEALAAGGDA